MVFRASALMLVLAISSAGASVQERINESRVPLPGSAERGFSGEIAYAFDTALNITTARFKASLASQSVFSRIFRGSPAVHTLIAAYQLVGRSPLNTPDSIRISFVSDEFSQSPSGNGLPPRPEAVLTIAFGDSVARFPLGIAQKTELWWPHDSVVRVAHPSQAGDALVNYNARSPQMHIERTATLRVSTCAFLDLLAGKDVHGTVAGLDFDINEDVIAGLRAFAAEMAAPRCHPGR